MDRVRRACSVSLQSRRDDFPSSVDRRADCSAAVSVISRARAGPETRRGRGRPPPRHPVGPSLGPARSDRAGPLPLLRLHLRRRQALETIAMPKLPQRAAVRGADPYRGHGGDGGRRTTRRRGAPETTRRRLSAVATCSPCAPLLRVSVWFCGLRTLRILSIRTTASRAVPLRRTWTGPRRGAC
jgi:hypothetical protein